MSKTITVALVILISATALPPSVQAADPAAPLERPLRKAPAPMYRDPVHDGAADPTLIWNRDEKCWWMLYTNRRADADNEKGVKWVHGTDIGIASTPDDGATWKYRGVARGLEFESGRNTFWAPEVVDFGGKYHAFISYVRGVPETWAGTRDIVHYTSINLLNWKFESIVVPGSIDACVHRLPNGHWRMAPYVVDEPAAWGEWTTNYRELIAALRARLRPTVVALAGATLCTEDLTSPKNRILDKLNAQAAALAKELSLLWLPTTPVTGVATTFLATLDVLKRAVASGKNLVITHEPTFYNHFDDTQRFEGDEVVAAKQAYIKEHGIIIWRFHDHWHKRRPDGIIQGMTERFGWGQYCDREDPSVYHLPETTAERLAGDLAAKFKTRTTRVVGNSSMTCSGVALVPGASGSAAQIRMLQRADVQVVLAGETPEWETVEYVRDAVAAGKQKCLILLGHANSEEAGMEYCARWLKTFIPEVPIEFIPAGDPFWTP